LRERRNEVSREKRRMCMRVVRLSRSTWLVLISDCTSRPVAVATIYHVVGEVFAFAAF
jgi:hypothetical protein